ncbi:hypothetical protein PIB30_081547 [Stylosanthes scabra]|uniref:RING-type domain-containing protein n=1 Tax=Stylosanthes scabra TaxID=79078 RepID=A0ABU6TSD2_9FABA|nr:hypothetical protein [Stylosanthes scabra]
MTSASELFHTRRHRLGRYNNLGLDSDHVPDLHHPRRHSRRLPHPPSSERAAVDRFERRYRRSLLNTESTRGVGAPPRLNPSDRLPVGVLLARARLLERLRGDPLSPNRQYERDSNPIIRDLESDFVSDLTSQMGRSHLLQEKPPGLTQEALDCLHVQVFSSRDAGQECSICLESFVDGDELICLPCHHKFHSACLDPWVRSCGDCPYCRRRILVNNNQHRRLSSE